MIFGSAPSRWFSASTPRKFFVVASTPSSSATAETAFTAAPRDTIGLDVSVRKSSDCASASRTFAKLDSTASIVFASRASSNSASA